MGNSTAAAIALVFTMLYGLGFLAFDSPPTFYVIGGALLVAAAWVAVGTLRNRSRTETE
ncbi:MAG TPA: hypothetical protein H9805_08200 [Candidatus Janibacter merdipullorum]|nr:hypothetical protein [Candidatus Janibacter merdipullorum]